jgi:hypothetical protein
LCAVRIRLRRVICLRIIWHFMTALPMLGWEGMDTARDMKESNMSGMAGPGCASQHIFLATGSHRGPQRKFIRHDHLSSSVTPGSGTKGLKYPARSASAHASLAEKPGLTHQERLNLCIIAGTPGQWRHIPLGKKAVCCSTAR